MTLRFAYRAMGIALGREGINRALATFGAIWEGRDVGLRGP